MATESLQLPAEWNISIVQGNDWSKDYVFADTITGDTFVAEILRGNEVMQVITNAKNSMTLTLSLTDTQTALLNGNYTWHLNRTRSGYTMTLLAGTFKVLVK